MLFDPSAGCFQFKYSFLNICFQQGNIIVESNFILFGLFHLF